HPLKSLSYPYTTLFRSSEGPGVARVRVVGPVQVPRSTAIRAIDAAVAGARLEVLGDVVGHEHRDAAGAAVRERGLDDQPQVGLGDRKSTRLNSSLLVIS